MKLFRFVNIFYSLTIVGLLFYSFTQIDLSLSFSKFPVLYEFQKFFQEIGYFNRPISTVLFLIIIFLMFIFYGYFLYKANKKELKNKDLWVLILMTSGILVFSYNAFSYDLFNYIFDAKIVTFYNENPYFHKALDYPNDPMLSFMRWTHRLYPYGPIWLGITIPISFIGLQIFIVTFALFKLLIAGFFIGSCYLIQKINKNLNKDDGNFGLVLFALNPLIIIESLISSHNDIVMIFFALWGIYLFFNGRKILAFLLIIISSQVKIPTIALILPIVLSFEPLASKLNIDKNKLILLFISSMTIVLIFVLTKMEIQPWYFLWILPFIAIHPKNKYLSIFIFNISLGLILRYTVFIFNGNWDGNGLVIRNSLTVLVGIIPVSFLFLKDKLINKL